MRCANRASHRRASRRPADAPGRHSGQDGEEVAGHHSVESPVARGGKHARSPVHGRGTESSLGRRNYLRVDHRGLALPRRPPRSLLASRDRLGDGPPSDCGSGRAGPHHGTREPDTPGRAPAPLGSRQSVCRHELRARTRCPRHHGQHEPQRDCWDNACIESFFGTLKRELVYHRHYATRDDATQDIFEYIEVFYNRQRRHSTLGYHSPAEYEARAAVA